MRPSKVVLEVSGDVVINSESKSIGFDGNLDFINDYKINEKVNG